MSGPMSKCRRRAGPPRPASSAGPAAAALHGAERPSPARRSVIGGGRERSILGILLLAVAAGLAAPARADDAVWSQTPYRVRVLLALEPAAEFADPFPQRLADVLGERLESVVGAVWEADVEAAEGPLRSEVLAGLEGLDAAKLAERYPEGDKLLLVAVSGDLGGYSVAARDLDLRTQRLGTPVRHRAGEPAKLRDVALDALWAAFAPVARIQRVEQRDVVLLPRAGALPFRDPTLAAVEAGDVFRPLIRHNDRDGSLRAVAEIPWSYLNVLQASGWTVNCRIHSGLRTPLSGRRRGRVEQLALKVLPPGEPTRLALRPRTGPDEFLAGFAVYAYAPDSPETTLLGHTDEAGSIVVPPDDGPLRILLVRSGGVFLARLPIVPGAPPEQTAEVANDNQRLMAEGVIRGIQERLVDQVARREVLVARARARLEAGDIDEAVRLVRELERLGTREDFARLVENERQRIFSADPLVQRQIEAMFRETREMAAAHLDPAPIEQIAIEVARAQRGGVAGS